MSLAKIHLEGLIAGLEMGSEIPVQKSELEVLLKLIDQDQIEAAMTGYA